MASFSEQIKVATWLQHEKLEQLPFGNHLARGTLPLKGYISQLQAYYLIHRELEQACRSHSVLQLSKIWQEELVKTSLLKADLEDLGSECVEEMPAAQGLVNLIKKSQPIELIGILYVFEGSVMGAAAMYPTVCQAYQLSEKGACYFKGYGSQTRSHWNAFKKNFDNVLENDTIAQSIIIASAQTTFEEVAALFIALWDNLQH